jgi:hypothetical protein
MTNNNFIHYLRNSSYNLNNRREQVNIISDDLSVSILENFKINHLIGLLIIIMLLVIIFIGYLIEQKRFIFSNIIPNFNLFKLIKYKYENIEVLPQYYNKKAKQWTSVSSLSMPLDLPYCPTLDRTEKGHNNHLFRVSIPYRRYSSINITENEITEH